MGELKWSEVEEWPDWVTDLFQYKGTTVLACMRGTMPAVAVPVLVQYAEPGDPMGLLEKYVIRAMSEVNIYNDEDIADLLGIDNTSFVSSVTDRYLSSGLVTRTKDGVELSPALARALHTGVKMVVREIEASVYCDPLGIYDSSKAYTKRKNNALLINYNPTDSDLHDDLSRRALELWVPEGCDFSSVVSDVQSGERLQRNIGAVVCRDRTDGTWFCGAYDPVTKNRLEGPRVEGFLSRTGAREAARAILKQHEPSLEEVELAESVEAEESAPPSTTPIPEKLQPPLESFTTREGLRKWKQDVSKARHEIVMFSPWIGSPALDWIKIFEDLLRKGVRILVGYGISQSEGTEDKKKSRPDIVERLHSLADQKGPGWFRLVWIGHSHWKQTIIDRNVAYTGSFNILSFAGEPDWNSGKVRNEDVVRIVYEPEVEKKRAVLLNEFRSSLLQEARDLGSVDSVEKWHRNWCALLGLFGDHNLIKEAVNHTPKKLDQLASCAIRLLDEANKSKSALDPEATRRILKEILADKVTGQGKAVHKTIKRLKKRDLMDARK